MAKRFISSEIWSDEWFFNLKPVYKLVYIYFFSNCDMSGFFKLNWKKINFEIGQTLDIEDTIKVMSSKITFRDKDCLINNFIKLQYPKINNSPDAPLHKSVLSAIDKNCLLLDVDSLYIDYRYSIDSLQVKVKVKEEVKEEVKEDSFSDFWNMYNKKVDKDKCYKKYIKLKESDIQKIKEHLPKYVKSTPDIQYRKNPLTYLNGGCWNDEIVNNGNSNYSAGYLKPKKLTGRDAVIKTIQNIEEAERRMANGDTFGF